MNMPADVIASKRMIAELKSAIDHQQPPDFIFFWGARAKGTGVTKACLSNWYRCDIVYEGHTFSNSEQLMMYFKAQLFKDLKTADRIKAETDPKAVKALGRQVMGFNNAIWEARRFDIMVRVNHLKFNQNAKLKTFLTVGTVDAVLVEASPFDRIWGIGMKDTEYGVQDPTMWKGHNLLGFALMAVRKALREVNHG